MNEINKVNYDTRKMPPFLPTEEGVMMYFPPFGTFIYSSFFCFFQRVWHHVFSPL